MIGRRVPAMKNPCGVDFLRLALAVRVNTVAFAPQHRSEAEFRDAAAPERAERVRPLKSRYCRDERLMASWKRQDCVRF